MKPFINWFLILVGIVLVIWFDASLALPRSRVARAEETRFFYNPYQKYRSERQLNNPSTRKAYERSEENWFGPFVRPFNRLFVWDTIAYHMLFNFGVMGFVASLVIRAIRIFYEWRDGDTINWLWQGFLAIAVPAAYVLAMVAVIIITPISGYN